MIAAFLALPWRRILHRDTGAGERSGSAYERTTIRRRIERRMMLRHIESLGDYCELLDRDPGELAALLVDQQPALRWHSQREVRVASSRRRTTTERARTT